MRTLYRIAGTVLLFDQITKALALSFLKPRISIPLFRDVFHLSFVENTGIAFGLFQDHPEFWTWIITISIVCLLVGSWFFRDQPLPKQLAFGFILGGAIGNWVDRIRFNYVIDFLDFRVWPVFNIADSFITIGVVFFIWFALRGR